MIKLAPYVRVGFTENDLYFGFGSIQQKITDPAQQLRLLKVAAFLKIERAEDDIRLFMKEQGFEVYYQEIMTFLKHGNYLFDDFQIDYNDRFSRNYMYYNLIGINPFEAQIALKNSHIIILGCGGIGNFVSYFLGTAGVGKITLFDEDIIEISNLGRQFLFTEDDIGQKKTDVLKRELIRRNSEIKIEIIDKSIRNEEDVIFLPKSDLIVLSADTPGSIVKWINEYCIQNNISFVNVGYVQDVATYGPFVIPNKTGCWACQELVVNNNSKSIEIMDLIRIIRSDTRPPSIGPINAIAASIACLDIIKYFIGSSKINGINKRIGFWTDEYHMEYQDANYNPNCSICGKLK